MSLESNKTLGGIGALLVAIGAIVPIIGIIGIILVMIALKGLAEYYKENAIFQNALYGIIFYIIAVVAAAFVLVGAFFGGMFADPLAFIGGVIFAVVLMFIFYLLGAIFFKKSFNILSMKSGEKMFDTAGLLLLIGAILTIIIIGAILMLVAWILVAVAFFSIKISAVPPPPSQPPPPPP
ncbi:MAG: DUF996 domain-containing protein [Candidatus Bathyarchaeia archaeon]